MNPETIKDHALEGLSFPERNAPFHGARLLGQTDEALLQQGIQLTAVRRRASTMPATRTSD